MKTIIIAISILLSMHIYAQNNQETKDSFVRVYDLEGQKIAKGRISEVGVMTLTLQKNRGVMTVSVSDIGSIKTRRSVGNNVLIGSVAGVTLGAIAGATTDDDAGWFGYSEAEYTVGGAVIVGTGGLAIGAITGLLKDIETYQIDGDQIKWQVFKASFK